MFFKPQPGLPPTMSNVCWHAFKDSLLEKTRLWLKETEKNKNYVDKVIIWLLPAVALRPPLASLSINSSKYTLLQNKRERGRWFRAEPPPPPPHPHRSFENRWRNMDISYITLKGIVWRFRFSLNFSKIFWFRDFMGKFWPNDFPNGSGVGVRKNSNFQNINILYIIF